MTSETTEIEALAKVAKEAYERDGATWAQVVEAVRDAVRAQDRARGGTLSAEELETSFEVIGLEWPNGVREIKSHMAAQGRTIAALQEKAERWEEEAEAQTARAGLAEKECDEARATIAARDARIAELEAMGGMDEERILAHKKRLGEALARAVAAESAVATLRQAVAPIARALKAALEDEDADGDEALLLRFHPITAAQARALVDTLATPAPEHPDTAALRATQAQLARLRDAVMRTRPAPEAFVGERTLTQDAYSRGFADGWAKRGGVLRAEVDAVLGDSGPSGGGEPVEPCRACGSTEPGHDPGVKLLEPTTPSDVAAEDDDDPHANHLQQEADARDRCRAGQHEAQGDAAGPRGASLCRWCGTDTATKTTAEDDWRTVEEELANLVRLLPAYKRVESRERALASIARLKDAPRKAAEAMRERCADLAWTNDPDSDLAERIRALPLD